MSARQKNECSLMLEAFGTFPECTECSLVLFLLDLLHNVLVLCDPALVSIGGALQLLVGHQRVNVDVVGRGMCWGWRVGVIHQ